VSLRLTEPPTGPHPTPSIWPACPPATCDWPT